MVTQGQRLRESLSHRPERTGERARVDPSRLPPSSRELHARRMREWNAIMGIAS
jgi:hypothetical protein